MYQPARFGPKGARRNSQKKSGKQWLSEGSGSPLTISAHSPLHTKCSKTMCFCAFGQHPGDHFERKSGDRKNRKKVLPDPERPDQSRGGQRPSKTTPKSRQLSRKDGRQMLENKAPEHRSTNSNGKTRVKTHVFAKCWKTKHQSTKSAPQRMIEIFAGPEIPRNKA